MTCFKPHSNMKKLNEALVKFHWASKEGERKVRWMKIVELKKAQGTRGPWHLGIAGLQPLATSKGGMMAGQRETLIVQECLQREILSILHFLWLKTSKEGTP